MNLANDHKFAHRPKQAAARFASVRAAVVSLLPMSWLAIVVAITKLG